MRRAVVAVVVGAILVAAGGAGGMPGAGVATATVTVAASGGGRVVSEPAGAIDCGARCTVQADVGSTLTLRAVPDGGRELRGWDGECSGRSLACALVVDGDATVSATFGAPTALETPKGLNVTRSPGGRVTSDPEGFVDCGATCTTAWPDGGSIELRAQPHSGFGFAGWDRDCNGTGACRLSLDTDHDVTALFTPTSFPSGSSALTVRIQRGGTQSGGVVVFVDGSQQLLECVAAASPCTYPAIDHGSDVLILPSEGTLDAWEGSGCVGSSDRCAFVLTGATSVTAIFRPGGPIPSFGVNVARAGQGRVVSTPRGIDCGTSATCAAAFGRKTRVTLSATPIGGSVFAGWGGDCAGTGSCSVLADTTRSVIATFRRARQTLRVELAGRGRGSVASAPAGIACPPECASAFPTGETVALTATPERGSRFAGWAGACTGTTCTVTLAADAVARATFHRCAVRDYNGFAVRALRAPRRVRAAVRLTGAATVRVALLRGPTVVRRAGPRRLAPGTHAFVLRAPRAGRHTVRLTVADACGSTMTRTRAVRLR